MLHRISIAVLAALLLIIAASCGHGKNTMSPTTMNSTHTASSSTASIENALAKLDSMPCPTGVTPEIWAKVKEAFRQRANARLSSKEASQLYNDQYTAVRDLVWEQHDFNDSVSLTWGYILPGDFNQDGLVDISDLTPFAQNYGGTWSGGPLGDQYNSMAAVCDANQDYTVGIYGIGDDLSVMASHFGDTIAGYSIEGDSVVDTPPTPSQYSTIAYGDHDDVGPKPYQARLRFRKEVSAVSATSYYWVRPYDMEVVYPAVPNYGEYSTDYADLRPEIGPIKPQTPSGQHGSAMKFSYSPDTSHAGPIVSQEWDFGDAGTPDSTTSATPTLTLADDPGYYECSLTIVNPYGSDLETFYVTVTQNQAVPIVNSVSQSTTEPTTNATFTADITNLPITLYSWRFSFNPPVFTSAAEPTVTLPTTAGIYMGRLDVSNDAGAAEPFNFQIQVGTPPNNLSVTVPETIVLNEAASFTASCSGSPTISYDWHFNLPDFDDEPNPNGSYTAVITPHDYGGERHGYVIASNGTIDARCDFTYYVHWNMLKLRTELVYDDQLEQWVEDTLPGDDGFVTVTAYIYDNGHPVGYLNNIYLEYDWTKTRPSLYAELTDYSQANWPQWNSGCTGGDIWAADGWWQPYGVLLPLPRVLFFYDPVSNPPNLPYESVFSTHTGFHAIKANISPLGGFESDIGLTGDDDYDQTVDIFNFRIYPAQGLLQGDFPFTTYSTCYKYGPPPNNTLLTYYSHYEDPMNFTHPFSNEPFVAIQGVAP